MLTFPTTEVRAKPRNAELLSPQPYSHDKSMVSPEEHIEPSPVFIPINFFGLRRKVAEIHTYGAYSLDYNDDIFSENDLNCWTNYLVTPKGTVRKYTPLDFEDIVIYTDVPYDHNHPDRR